MKVINVNYGIQFYCCGFSYLACAGRLSEDDIGKNEAVYADDNYSIAGWPKEII